MKIITVDIKNFNGLKNLKAEMQGRNLIITGKNGIGKSRLLNFIRAALGDKNAVPLEAEGSGTVITNKDGEEYTLNVRFKDNKPIIDLVGPDGLKDSRKSVLANFTGAMDFDMDEFVRLSETDAGRKKQVEIYKKLLPAEVQESIRIQEAKIKQWYDDRTMYNREAKSLEGFIKELPLWGEDLDIQPVDVSDLQQKVEEATKHNNAILGVKQGISERQNIKSRNNTELEKLRAEIARIEAEDEKLDIDIKKGEDWLATHKEVDVSGLNQQIADASDINAKATQAAELKKNMEKLENFKNQSGEMTAFIDSARHEVQQTIREMDAIVEGLTFDDDQLYYNNVPVANRSLSTAEIISLGVRMKMAENPELGILFIENGQNLDEDKLKIIQQLAKQHDWQVLMEEVHRGQNELKIEIMPEEWV